MAQESGSKEVTALIKKFDGWKSDRMAELRAAIKEAEPDVTEEVKWKMPSKPDGLPVWSRGEVICIGEVFKDKVSLTFFKGAQLKDPENLFNSRLKSKTDRAIDFYENDSVKKTALKKLVREAVKLNEAKE